VLTKHTLPILEIIGSVGGAVWCPLGNLKWIIISKKMKRNNSIKVKL